MQSTKINTIQIPKLKQRANWAIWKLQIESNLQFHEFKVIVTRQIDEPAPVTADASNNRRRITRQV